MSLLAFRNTDQLVHFQTTLGCLKMHLNSFIKWIVFPSVALGKLRNLFDFRQLPKIAQVYQLTQGHRWKNYPFDERI